MICTNCNINLNDRGYCHLCGSKASNHTQGGFVGHDAMNLEEPDFGDQFTVNVRMPVPKIWDLIECRTERHRHDKRTIRLRFKADRFGRRRATTRGRMQ